MTIKAQFDSTCKTCRKSWTTGSTIYWDRSSKATCSDVECFKKQGGSLEEKKFFKRQIPDILADEIFQKLIDQIPDPDDKEKTRNVYISSVKEDRYKQVRFLAMVKLANELGFKDAPSVLAFCKIIK